MARKKIQPIQPETNTDIFTQIRLAESYTSLIIGVVVVIAGSILVTSALKSINIIKQLNQHKEISSQKTENLQVDKKETPVVAYVVAEGDTLKSISLKFYNTEDNWEIIAKENNISNPDAIEVGTTIKLSKVTANGTQPQVAGRSTISVDTSAKITGNTYTVGQDERLWDIAVRAYGDGYRWSDIAQANNLSNPDVLAAGTILKIPR